MPTFADHVVIYDTSDLRGRPTGVIPALLRACLPGALVVAEAPDQRSDILAGLLRTFGDPWRSSVRLSSGEQEDEERERRRA